MKYFKRIIDFILNLFNEHPKSAGETYMGHMRNAIFMSLLSLAMFLVLLVHSIFPFIFKKTGCRMVSYINDKCNRAVVFYIDSDF
jgi:hypothetical protein